jgi:hypothetical protein
MDLDTARPDRAEIDRAIEGQTICTLFQATVAAHGPEPAMVTKRGGTWVGTSWHVQTAVDRINAELARVEQIKRFTILPDDWSAGSDELTPTLKVRRRAVHDKYRALIDAMYAAPLRSDASPAA